MRPRKHRVLHLITRLDLGGAQQNTLFCTAHHDRSCFDVQLLAEKIETEDDLQLARELKFDYFQGFFIGRPSSEW